ncbi:hypothetical protein GA0070607_4808 [Micromonospora coriariae]|uniref:Lipoprotein n=1 Tax=Micromonospora coriariae TaxID=285665 RepID=A0A1C4X8E5_9ACTN|nr:hypothetical protein [Micromonospora coriariae]SCF04471.1 hypothetical protein GA0070607_4808 [Micromonospora coriariae]
MSAPVRRRPPLLRYGLLAPLLLATGAAGCGESGAAGAAWATPAPTVVATAPTVVATAPTAAATMSAATAVTPTPSNLPASASPTPKPRTSATARAGSAAAPAPAGRATPAPEFPRGYTLLSQTCTLQAGNQVYVSRSGKTKGNFRFCTQRLRKNDTGAYHLNPYVFVEPFFYDDGRWTPDSREPLSLTITCRVSHAGEQDYSLTATSPSGNGPGHTASCGRLVPHAVTPTTGSDAYTIRFSGYTSGGYYGVLAFDTEVHFPGAGKPTPEQRVTVPD